MKIRYSETFYSFQGEAELAGTPTVWLRFFGCNLECNGFGQKNPALPESHKLPYKEFDPNRIRTVEELPVWEYGCDSSYSWSMKYKHLAKDSTVEGICDELESKLPYGSFINPFTGQENMLAFTGGEPMLRQRHMKAIVGEFINRANIPKIITVETNGTKPLNPELQEYINTYLSVGGIRWHWAISPKILHTSGEKDAVDVGNFMSYVDGVKGTSCIKFVCNGSTASWREIAHYKDEIIEYCLHAEIPVPDIWIMPVGATKEEQEKVANICIMAMQQGYKVATRNHAYVFGNQIGT